MRPACPTLTVPLAKLVGYLLDLGHPVGEWKAKFFLRHGFSRDDPELLADALIRQAHAGWPGSLSPGSRSLLNVITGPLMTPSAAEPIVRTVWELSEAGTEARLITAYPPRSRTR